MGKSDEVSVPKPVLTVKNLDCIWVIWLICVIWVILTINRMDCMDMVGISWEYIWDTMGYAFGHASINH